MLRLFVSTSPIIAWLAGVMALLGCSFAFEGRISSGRDLGALCLWAAWGVLIFMPAFYWPMFLFVQKMLHGREPIFTFPLAGVALAILPTWLLVKLIGVGANSVVVFIFFAAVGTVTGFAFALRGQRDTEAEQAVRFEKVMYGGSPVAVGRALWSLTRRSLRWFGPFLIAIGIVAVLMIITTRQIKYAMNPVTGADRDLSHYSATLAKYRPSRMVDHFPADIPVSARNVHFATFEGGLQAGAYIQLRMLLPRDQIQKLGVQVRAMDVQVNGRRDLLATTRPADSGESWGITHFYTADDPEQWQWPDTYTWYTLRRISFDMDNGRGIAISYPTNEVVYWATGGLSVDRTATR